MNQPTDVIVPVGRITNRLRAKVEAAVADLVAKDKRGAILAIAGAEEITVTVATKLGDEWLLAAEVAHKWGGDVTGQVMVMGSW